MSYVSAKYHCVFSTKWREPLLTRELRDRLWPYMRGIARSNGIETLAIGGVEDHVHLLIGLPSTMPLSRAMQLIKGGSSRWINEMHFMSTRFAWQKEYAAFSVSVSMLASVKRYIANQEHHHSRQTFKNEFRSMLNKARLPFDERYLWD